MRSMLFCLFLALVTFTFSVAPQGSPGVMSQALTGPIYLTDVTLIDTVEGRELPDRTVVISGDRISEVTCSPHWTPLLGSPAESCRALTKEAVIELTTLSDGLTLP